MCSEGVCVVRVCVVEKGFVGDRVCDGEGVCGGEDVWWLRCVVEMVCVELVCGEEDVCCEGV